MICFTSEVLRKVPISRKIYPEVVEISGHDLFFMSHGFWLPLWPYGVYGVVERFSCSCVNMFLPPSMCFPLEQSFFSFHSKPCFRRNLCEEQPSGRPKQLPPIFVKKHTKKKKKKKKHEVTAAKCTITKTCLYNFDPLKPHFYIVELGFTGVYIIFLFLLKNIYSGYSSEPPRRGGSNEYP